jgi:hypothetical protein
VCKLILTTVPAASEAAARLKPSPQTACKPRANCLKPKEISMTARRFDLRRAANYLKVKTIAEAEGGRRRGQV